MAAQEKLNTSKYVPALVVLLIIAAFFIGSLTTKISTLQGETGTVKQEAAGDQQAAAQQPGQPDPNKVYDVKTGHLPALGNKDAKNTIVVFSDFECPFCRRFNLDSLSQIKKDYVDTGKAKLYFRHFPLEFHKMAKPAAMASECANEQGKFWEMHDKMFNEIEALGENGTFTADNLKTWAADLGLDTTKFNGCLDSNKYDAQITQDAKEAAQVDVGGTPTTFVNGKIVVGALPYEEFKKTLEAEIK